MIHLHVMREQGDANCTPGALFVNGRAAGYTLEPRRDQSQGKPFCIPAGTYPVTLEFSNHFQECTPHVNNVPGFSEIEIHRGNSAPDTRGCLLVGETEARDWVGQSKVAFDELMKTIGILQPDGSWRLYDPEGCEILYEDPVPTVIGSDGKSYPVDDPKIPG